MSAADPAIPVKAAVPLSSLQDLLMTVARDWPETTEAGVLVAWDITERGSGVAARIDAYDWRGAERFGSRTYDGQWDVGGRMRWTTRR